MRSFSIEPRRIANYVYLTIKNMTDTSRTFGFLHCTKLVHPRQKFNMRVDREQLDALKHICKGVFGIKENATIYAITVQSKAPCTCILEDQRPVFLVKDEKIEIKGVRLLEVYKEQKLEVEILNACDYAEVLTKKELPVVQPASAGEEIKEQPAPVTEEVKEQPVEEATEQEQPAVKEEAKKAKKAKRK